MSKGYWIVRANINNQEEYLKYIKKATKVVESFNGKFLVRGGKQKEFENSGYERTVIVNLIHIMMLLILTIPQNIRML